VAVDHRLAALALGVIEATDRAVVADRLQELQDPVGGRQIVFLDREDVLPLREFRVVQDQLDARVVGVPDLHPADEDAGEGVVHRGQHPHPALDHPGRDRPARGDDHHGGEVLVLPPRLEPLDRLLALVVGAGLVADDDLRVAHERIIIQG
jgi:hypothetical protein